jgi:hypothetical protein
MHAHDGRGTSRGLPLHHSAAPLQQTALPPAHPPGSASARQKGCQVPTRQCMPHLTSLPTGLRAEHGRSMCTYFVRSAHCGKMRYCRVLQPGGRLQRSPTRQCGVRTFSTGPLAAGGAPSGRACSVSTLRSALEVLIARWRLSPPVGCAAPACCVLFILPSAWPSEVLTEMVSLLLSATPLLCNTCASAAWLSQAASGRLGVVAIS